MIGNLERPGPAKLDERASRVSQLAAQDLEDAELGEEEQREQELEAQIVAQQAKTDSDNAKAARLAASRSRQAALQEQLVATIAAREKQKAEQERLAAGVEKRAGERHETEKRRVEDERQKKGEAEHKAAAEQQEKSQAEVAVNKKATEFNTRKASGNDGGSRAGARSAAGAATQKPSIVDKAVARLTGKTAQAEQEARLAGRKPGTFKVVDSTAPTANVAEPRKRGRPPKTAVRRRRQPVENVDKSAHTGERLEAELKTNKQPAINDSQKRSDDIASVAVPTDEDSYLVQLRDRGNTWKEVGTLWRLKTGKDLAQTTLQSRYKRAKSFLKQPCNSPGTPPKVDSQEHPGKKPHGPSTTTPQSPPSGVQNGLVDHDDDTDSDEGNAVADKSDLMTPAPASTVSGQLENPTTDSSLVPASESRATMGGKTYNSETFQAYLASLEDDVSVVEEPSEHLEGDSEGNSESEDVIKEAQKEDSPFADSDNYHWEYQIKRKTWLTEEDENEVQWFVCGDSDYSSLVQANAAAGQEILKERDGMGLGPSVRRWSHELNENDMAQYHAETPEGHIKVIVDRFLRNPTEGKWPTSKLGWIKKQVYLIWQKTRVRSIKPGEHDELFEEPQEPTGTVTLEMVDGCYTILDEANREAGRLVLTMTTNAVSRRMDDQLKRAEAQKKMRERLDELESKKEAFREEVKLGEERVVELWVEERMLKGPRNI